MSTEELPPSDIPITLECQFGIPVEARRVEPNERVRMVVPAHRMAEIERENNQLRDEIAKLERERSALSFTISDMSYSLRKLDYEAKGHSCDYRKVCDSLRDKIKGHQERHELIIQAFASANDRQIVAALHNRPLHRARHHLSPPCRHRGPIPQAHGGGEGAG